MVKDELFEVYLFLKVGKFNIFRGFFDVKFRNIFNIVKNFYLRVIYY